MSKPKWTNSLIVLFIGLITPVLVWILLHSLAVGKVQSFDPNPLVQELVTSAQTISRAGTDTIWVNLVGVNGEWSVKEKDAKLTPLAEWKPTARRLVLLLEAQGPTLALKLHRYLKENALDKKIILLSNSDGLLKDLRYHDGQATMSCGQAYVIRFHALKRLGLEGLMTIDMSAVYLDPKLFSQELKELTDYFVSHNVAVFVGPLGENSATINEALDKKANILVD
jgi:hypothetical protein